MTEMIRAHNIEARHGKDQIMTNCPTGGPAEVWPGAMVTAHRKLPKGADEWLRPALRERLIKLRSNFGTVTATSGMAIGGDTIFADVALEVEMPLIAAVPFPSQPDDQYGPKWSLAQKKHWAELIERASYIQYVSPADPLSYSTRVQMLHARNTWMLQHNQVVLAIWAPANKRGSGTYDCILKAVSGGMPVILFNLASKTITRPSRRRWAELLDKPALARASHSTTERIDTRG